MRRNEILQNVKSLSEVRLDWELNGLTCCICHQSSHTCKLLNLLIRTTGSRISHHEYIVIFIKTCEQEILQMLICLLPDLNYCLISLLV